jgi:hypothetical protein
VEKFLQFLHALKNEGNTSILESIAHGYIACFESINVPKLKLRIATTQEREDYRAKNSHLPPEKMKTLIVITSPDDKVITYATSPNDAEFIKGNLERKANSILNAPIPPMPPTVLPADSETAGVDPELAKSLKPEEADLQKSTFWVIKQSWDEYLNYLRDMSEAQNKFKKSHSWAFKTYKDED